MSDRLYPLDAVKLARWLRDEWSASGSMLGLNRKVFFQPSPDDSFKTSVFRQNIDSPIGVAAGPHTQMAQNIIAAWLCGARFIELKTVQTLDKLDVSKPCIDMEDAGFNVEWSQELRIAESIREYTNAWVLIHALHRMLGMPGDSPGAIFNMSVGYNMEGILKSNVQEFFRSMDDGSNLISAVVNDLRDHFPGIDDIHIPKRISDNITLSTMHGCPPEEIGAICRYMLEERGLHTYVKLNPTLLGARELRRLLNDELGFSDITVPDEAFGHDITFDHAVALIRDLREIAEKRGLCFGVKLSNTLEVINHRKVFSSREKQMYMSGRPLHAITVQVARKLQEEFDGELDMSFSGGADAFNIPALLGCGMKTVTVCSDLLRSGGYARMTQYYSILRKSLSELNSVNLDDWVVKSAGVNDKRKAALHNLASYAEHVSADKSYHADTYQRADTKSLRPLGSFDCIKAPCTDVCPIEQKVPQYMRMVKTGQLQKAADVVERDNTMPAILGRACHHPCHARCVRSHLDQPVEIREIKRFIVDHARANVNTETKRKERIAIIGAGPCGLATSDFLSRAGYQVTIMDARDREGGMVSSSIPGYRASDDALLKDTSFLVQRGVQIRHNVCAGKDFTLTDLRKEGFDAVVIAIGAQKAGKLGMEGENVDGVWDSLSFLKECREGRPPKLGNRVGVVGGGDVAMDCARTAWRIGAEQVSVIYRRTRYEMPAQYDEITGLLDENIPVRELLAPKKLLAHEGRLSGLVCSVMELGEPDAGGRRKPRPVEGKFEELPLDALIVAINQSGDFDWLKNEGVEFNSNGYIEVKPTTLETCLDGVYAGGDAIGDGPATIVKALGDGKRIARSIRERFEGSIAPTDRAIFPKIDRGSIQLHRATRSTPESIPQRPAGQRRDFQEVVETLGADAARREAARCLDCDHLCSYCVGVCPNLALFTYEHIPAHWNLPIGRIHNGQWFTLGGETIRINQPYQVAVYSDFCNECGNCVTFCPSIGKPYKDKPRIYLNADEFVSETDNAFLMEQKGRASFVYSRVNGETHTLAIADTIVYTTPELRAEWHLDWHLVAVHGTSVKSNKEQVSLRHAVEMASLFYGVTRSVSYMPLIITKEA
ncbi:MAG TPA: putative selenate reductase subunit YgfK [Kiritimatiellia bacterium]|nr:putative selenate reductase subunit YgfK [Kiritimatiellia bacterium]